MGSLTSKIQKKKSRQAKIHKASLFSFAAAVGFLNASSSFYLREIYNVKTLFPSWTVAKKDILFNSGDLIILSRDLLLKILVDSNLLIAEQVRQITMIVLVAAVVYMLGKSWPSRFALLLYVGGLASFLYYVFLFAFLKWPDSLLSKDILTLFPVPVIVPVYMPISLSAFALLLGLYLVFKKK